ncbi:hypothetical protein [Thermococcus sp. Bubb.Bath]|nr:hypothetical protein [Thermococcus sp. Bubb.Bath]
MTGILVNSSSGILTYFYGRRKPIVTGMVIVGLVTFAFAFSS